MKHNEQPITYAPITAIDKVLALTPLFTSLKAAEGNMAEIFSSFEQQYELVKQYATDNDEFSNRTQARLAFLVSHLESLGADHGVPSSDVIIGAVERVRNLSATSKDFNAAIPLENGFWGIEVAAQLHAISEENQVVRDNEERILLHVVTAINNVSELLQDTDEMLVIRSQNAISRVVANELRAVLQLTPKSNEELTSALEYFDKAMSSFYRLYKCSIDVFQKASHSS